MITLSLQHLSYVILVAISIGIGLTILVVFLNNLYKRVGWVNTWLKQIDGRLAKIQESVKSD